MIAKVSVVILMLLLAFTATFWGDSFIFGLMFMLFAAVAWFKWDLIRDGFAAAKGESQIPIIRLSANMLGGLANMFRGRQSERRSSPSSG